jgi:hypothetical protein
MIRLSILDDLHFTHYSVVEGQHDEASAAVGFWISVSRDRARKPKAEEQLGADRRLRRKAERLTEDCIESKV